MSLACVTRNQNPLPLVFMTLITCPDCGSKVSDRASACIHCGRPADSPQVAASVGLSQGKQAGPQGAKSGYACPRCSGEDVKKLSIVHASGSSNLQAMTLVGGAGIGGGELGVGIGAAHTSGIQQTTLSSKVAPPLQRRAMSSAGITFYLICFLSLIFSWVTDVGGPESYLWGIGSIACLIVVVVRVHQRRAAMTWNETEWPLLRAAWDRSFMCMRCGHIWEFTEIA
jgi:DNA-directed RNA polymerase subunit RPC12/RpoP